MRTKRSIVVYRPTKPKISSIFRPQLIVFSTVLALSLVGCFGKAPSATTALKQLNSSQVAQDLVVSNWDLVRDQFGSLQAQGVLENRSERTYSVVTIEINLYDAGGAQVGSTMATGMNLEAHGKLKWTAPILESNVATAKLMGVSGY